MKKRDLRCIFLQCVPKWLIVPALLLIMPAGYASDIVYCEVDYDIVNDWGAGFQVNVTVINTTPMPIEGYELEWNMSETLTAGWNATFSQSGSTVTASNPVNHWNGTIQPNPGSVTFGFQASNASPPADIPPLFTLNGIECNPDGTSSSSSSSSSTSSSGGIDATVSHSAPVCPDSSDGVVIGGDSTFVLFDPDDYVGSTVAFRHYLVEGGPVHSQYSSIRYANGSDFNRPMRLEDRENPSVVIEQIDFPPTGGWDNWEDLIIQDQVLDGRINLVSLSEVGGPNLRSIGATINMTNCRTGSGCGWGKGDGPCPDSSSSSSSSSTSSSSGGGLSCDHVVTDEWGAGFVAVMRMTNNGSTMLSGWEVCWEYLNNAQRTGGWNANVTGINPYCATSPGWNNAINPGQTVEFGIQGSKPQGELPEVEITVCTADGL